MDKKNIYEALAKAQGEMQAVHKDSNNPHFKSKYASLDNIIEMSKPILSRNGLAIVQMPVFEEGMCGVSTTITHSSGESIDCGELLLPLGRGGGAQGAGSSITYARRYSISAVLCISTDEDDDGNGAQQTYQNQSQQAQAAPINNESQKATKEQLEAFLKACEGKGYNAPENVKDMSYAQLGQLWKKWENE